MDPIVGLCAEQGIEVTAQDLGMMDALGWTLAVDVLAHPDYRFTTAQVYRLANVVPEPTTWALMILGFGLTGAAMRRHRGIA